MSKRGLFAVCGLYCVLLSGATCDPTSVMPGPLPVPDPLPVADPLTVNAGPDQNIGLGTTAKLVGSAGGGLPAYSFQWLKMDGPDQTLVDANTDTATVTGLNVGTTTYQLTVRDDFEVSATDTVNVTVAPAGPCPIMPVGLIHDRWIELDGAAGPLGCAMTEELPVAGTNARKTTFEHGEIVWSPDQGSHMVVAAYQQDDNIIVNWGDTAPNDYDKFIVRWDRDGVNMGQADVDSYIDRTNGFFVIHTFPPLLLTPEAVLLPGHYAVIVEGCHMDVLGSDCDGFTVPAFVDYKLPPIPTYPGCDLALQPFGLIGERWAQLGGAEGPLGCPVEAEHARGGANVRSQAFLNGEIAFSPDQGETMTIAAYLVGDEFTAVWGNTAPYTYDKFILRLDRDGGNVWQEDLPGGRSGRWSTKVNTPGLYSVIVEGCDTGLGGSTCSQHFTAPASVPFPIPLIGPPPAPPPPPPCNGAFQPFGLIGERWVQLGGATSPLGCPLEAEHEVQGLNARAQAFEHGEITYSPDQGPRMVLAVYQQGKDVVASWGETAEAFFKFIIRLDYEAGNVGQAEVFVPGNSGTYAFHSNAPEDNPSAPTLGNGAGRYFVIVEGCTVLACKGFTAPASVNYVPVADIALANIPTPRTVEDALRDKKARARKAAEAVAFFNTLDGDFGDGQVTNAIAKLYLVDDTNHADPIPRAFRARFNMRTEVNNAIRLQRIVSKSGTTTDFPCKRTGEYDAVLKGYIPMLYRYSHLLDPDVRYHLLHLLNKSGPHDLADDTYCGLVGISETENHRLMIESSRYLTNQLFAKRSNYPRFDNARNDIEGFGGFAIPGTPMDTFILSMLQEFLKNDFIEYNSRPYGRYSWAAIQNLYDYADDSLPGGHKVKVAAGMVLDYLSAKVAVSSNDARRNPPYRRRVSHNHSDLFHFESDPLKDRFLIYTAPTLVMNDFVPKNHIKNSAVSEMVLAAASSYQPPNLILDLMVNPAHRSFYQRFRHAGAEVYSAEPDFLISGGGIPTNYAYTVSGAGSAEDLGVVQETCLMPTGQYTTIEQMIRFAVPGEGNFGAGMCVAPGFACGFTPTVPYYYTLGQRDNCWLIDGDWLFVDEGSGKCKDADHQEFGFYAVVYGMGKPFGFLEAVPKAELNGASLGDFASVTLQRNGERVYDSNAENIYTAWGGNDIHFNIQQPNPIVSTGIAAIDSRNYALGDWPLAQGDILNSDGHSGVITINNPFTGEGLYLDFRDVNNPARMPP